MRQRINCHFPTITKEFNQADEIFCNDHMPVERDFRISRNGVPYYFKNTFDELLSEQGVDSSDKTFIFNHYLWFEDYKDQAVYTGECFMGTTIPLARMDWPTVPEYEVTQHFTFMSNKARPHRILASSIIANLFNGKQFKYSYNNGDNYQLIIEELLLGCDYNFDKTLILPDKWFDFSFDGPKFGYGGRNIDMMRNHRNFEKVLYTGLYENSAVSLVTEPAFYERGFGITEKVVMSIYSGHFMIMLGSYGAPDFLTSLGFDMFDDVIDHSYQYIEHPGQRVAEAFLRNLDLLNDVERMGRLRADNISRLNKNLDLVRNIPALIDMVNKLNNPKLMEKTNTSVWTWPATMQVI